MKTALILSLLKVQRAYATIFACDPNNPDLECYCEAVGGCGTGTFLISNVANRIIDTLSTFIGGIAVVAFLWGAIRMTTSGGEEEGKTAGRNTMIAASVGIFLAILGKAIVFFVQNFVLDTVGIPDPLN